MFLRLILALIVIVFLFYGLAYFRQQPKNQQKKLSWKAASIVVISVVLLLIATGRVHWLTGIIAAMIPFLKRLIPIAIRLLPFLSQLQRKHGSSTIHTGNNSKVQSDYLIISLDHDTGDMEGEVIAGLFSGKKLNQLSKTQLQELLDYYEKQDSESHELLFAYLKRHYDEEAFCRNNATELNTQEMSHSEALEILGLKNPAGKEEIIRAHKKLMQKLHPDRGGSNYLAAKVNQAKDFLLKEKA